MIKRLEYLLLSPQRSRPPQIDFLFQLGLLVVLVPVILACFVTAFGKVYYAGFDLGAFVIGLCLIAGACLWIRELNRQPLPTLKIDIRSSFVLLAAFLVFVYSRWGIQVPVWLDEYLQFAVPHTIQITTEAARQQQPPLDYYLSFLNFHSFGVSELSSRSYAYLFGAMSFLYFILYCIYHRLNFLWILLFSIVIGFNRVGIWYNFESRPISLGILLAVLTIYFFQKYFLEDCRKFKIEFILSGTLLNYSLGLQPLVIFGALFGFYICYHFVNSLPNTRLIRNLFLISIPVALSMPINLIIFYASLKERQFFSSWQTSFGDIPRMLIHEFQEVYKELYFIGLEPMMYGLLMAISMLMLLNIAFEKNGRVLKPLKDAAPTITFLTVSYGLYIFLFSFINWQMTRRYFVVIHFSILMILAWQVAQGQSWNLKWGHQGSPWLRRVIPRWSGIVLVLLASLPNVRAYIEGSEHWVSVNTNRRSDWKTASRILHEKGVSEYVFTHLPFRRVGYSSPPTYGLHFYPPKNGRQEEYNRYGHQCLDNSTLILCSRILNDARLLQVKDWGNFVFVINLENPHYAKFEERRLWRKLDSEYIFSEGRHVVYFVVPFEGLADDEIVRFFDKFIELDPKNEANFFILEELVVFYSEKGDRKRALNYLKRIEALEFRKDKNPVYTRIEGLNRAFIRYMEALKRKANSKDG